MEEVELKKYWMAYTEAWKLLKNNQNVTEKHICELVKKSENTVFNRLFCLVVWKEINRIRNGKGVMRPEQYKKAIDDAWHLFKRYSDPNDTEAYWDELVCDIKEIGEEFNNCSFISDLLVHVTLEEIERIWRAKKEV